MKTHFNTIITALFTTLALSVSGSAFAKDAEPKIANDSAKLPAELTQTIAKTAIAMGVKEPLNITKDGDHAKISGGNAAICTVKLSGGDAPKMLGIACK